MKARHILEIARALLMARAKQTLVAAVGVAFSVAFFISLLGFMEGLNSLLDGLVLNRTPHIRLFNDLKPSAIQPIDLDSSYKDYHSMVSSVKPSNARNGIYDAERIIKKIMSDRRVYGVAPKVSAQVFYNLGNIELNGLVSGVDVVQEAKLFNFNTYIVEGNSQDLMNRPNTIVLGSGLAQKILAKKGDLVQVTTTKGEKFSLKVIGFFQSGMVEFDKIQSYVSLATCQKLLGESNHYVSEIQVKLINIDQAPVIAKEYEELFGVNTEDIQTANAQFETGSSARTIISFSVGIVLLIVAGFGIYNILNMMIYEKMDTIAILKATGFSSADVRVIFISQAIIIGIIGGVLGLLLGYFVSVLIDQTPFNSHAIPNMDTYPVNYNPTYYFIGFGFAMISTYFAGYFPSRKAGKIDPVDIIRGQ